MRWLIGALIGVICAVTFMYGYVVRQPVKIQYSVNKLTMFFVNFVTFMFAVMCIRVFFEMSIKYNEKIQTDSIIKAYAIQTIRQGGGALIVTILVGVMNRVMIQCYELEYFSSYNPIIYKINYTIICLFCSIIFLIFAHTINVSPIDNPVLGQAMAWLLTTIQIWISFDIFVEKRQRIGRRICNHLLRKEVFGYVFSLAPTPIFMGIILWILYRFGISYRYNYHVLEVLKVVLYIVAIFIMTFFIIIWKETNKSEKAEIIFKKKLNVHLRNMNERKTIIYDYKKMKIKIHIKKKMINICVLEREVRIGKHNKLNHKNECQLNRLFGQSEWKKYECNDKGVNEMLLWLNEYEEERRNVANQCREQVKETYFKDHKSCFS